jgi:hypothetical protein
MRQHGQNGSHLRGIVGYAVSSADSLSQVRDGPAGPAADLVAEGPESAKDLGPDRTFANDTAIRSGDVPHGAHLDGIRRAIGADQ